MHFIYYLEGSEQRLCGYLTNSALGHRVIPVSPSTKPSDPELSPTDHKATIQSQHLPKIKYLPSSTGNSTEKEQIDASDDRLIVTISANPKATFYLVDELGAGLCLTHTGDDEEAALVTLSGKACFESSEAVKLPSPNKEASYNMLPGGKVEILLSEGVLGLVALMPNLFVFQADSGKVKLLCSRNGVSFPLPATLSQELAPVKIAWLTSSDCFVSLPALTLDCVPKSSNGDADVNLSSSKWNTADLPKDVSVLKHVKSKTIKEEKRVRVSSPKRNRQFSKLKAKKSKSRQSQRRPKHHREKNVQKSQSAFLSRHSSQRSIKSRQPKSLVRIKSRASVVLRDIRKRCKPKSGPAIAKTEEKNDVELSLKLCSQTSDLEGGVRSLSELLDAFAAKAMADERTVVAASPLAPGVVPSDSHHWVLYYKHGSASRPVGVFSSARIGWTPEKPLPAASRLSDGRLDIRTKQPSNEKDYDSVAKSADLVSINAVGAGAVVRIYGEKASGYAFARGGCLKLNGRLLVTNDLNTWTSQLKSSDSSSTDGKSQVEVLWGRLSVYVCDQDIILLVTKAPANNFRIAN